MSPVFVRVNPGDPIQAQNLDQVIDALNGTTAKGVPIAVTAVNDATNYALTVQNIEPTGTRTLNVLKSDGTSMIRVDSSGVTLGSPLNLAAGSITTPAIANSAVTNAKLASDTARANLLTNGGFEFWQRGAGPFTANNQATADRWVIVLTAPSTVSVSRDTANIDSPSSSYCVAVTYTHAAGGSVFLQQQSADLIPALRGRQVTFSMRVRTATANAVRLRFNDGVTGVQNSAYHSGSGAYETLSMTYSVAASASAINPTIEFPNVSCTAYLDNAMLVIGSVAADYVPLHPADELVRCQRYYAVLNMSGVVIGGSAGVAGNREFTTLALPTTMAGSTTVTVSPTAQWSKSNTSNAVPDFWGAASGAVISLSVYATAAGECFLQGTSAAQITVECLV